jgi:hypothetical protein
VLGTGLGPVSVTDRASSRRTSRKPLDHGAEVIVLTQGIDLMLHTIPATTALLQDRHTEVIVAETRETVQGYNALARRPSGRPVHEDLDRHKLAVEQLSRSPT